VNAPGLRMTNDQINRPLLTARSLRSLKSAKVAKEGAKRCLFGPLGQ
jgi:hypothetical protein